MFDLGLNVHLNRVDAIFFFFYMRCSSEVEDKNISIVSFHSPLDFYVWFFFAQSLQSVILCVLFVNMFLLFCFILAL